MIYGMGHIRRSWRASPRTRTPTTPETRLDAVDKSHGFLVVTRACLLPERVDISHLLPQVWNPDLPRQRPESIWGSQTLVSLNLRLKDILGPATRVKKKKKKTRKSSISSRLLVGVVLAFEINCLAERIDWWQPVRRLWRGDCFYWICCEDPTP